MFAKVRSAKHSASENKHMNSVPSNNKNSYTGFVLKQILQQSLADLLIDSRGYFVSNLIEYLNILVASSVCLIRYYLPGN